MKPEDDLQLKSVLREWQVPGAPPSLVEKLDRARTPWWRRALTASIPVPVPLAVCLTVVLLYGAWRATAPAPCTVAQQPVCLSDRNC